MRTSALARTLAIMFLLSLVSARVDAQRLRLASAVVVGHPDSVLITVNELGLETRVALNVGVGTDFRIPLGPAGIGVRFELSDHMHQSPVSLQVTTLDASDFGTQQMPNFGVVHNLRVAAGVVVHFGR